MRSVDLPTHARAQRLRRDAPTAEKIIWRHLRNRSLAGHKFIRQSPIGPYFVDFVCRERKLIVEVDGATHSTASEVAHDLLRTKYLQQNGYRVLRVSNAAVRESIEGVLELILAAMEEQEG
ncbi:endonuclease domain-containing protein [Labrys monachus]|uniref:Very-short-patch-repair endonuclease n=1 Tax=Labrys monachus TaxID=217067 RepID=A0ABU0FNI9_9HYPH|nr:DUF559 domain-containing protein [Labrys monachus]MDQ0396177.1 very-short-patch-repair endonuclease [Labrys monachus]